MHRLRRSIKPKVAGLRMLILFLLMTTLDRAIGKTDVAIKDHSPSPPPTDPNNNRITPNIIGGVQADGVRFPWSVVFYEVDDSSINGRYGFCGGSLIVPRVVLTAAHCVQRLNFSGVRAVIGATWWETATPVHEIQEVYSHPGYQEDRNTGEQLFDIAIVVLKKASKKRPVKLAQKGAVPPASLTVLGYGTTSEYVDEMSSVLRMVDVPSIPTTTCQQMWDARYASGSIRNEIRMRVGQSCSAGQAGRDACVGDSGGPVIQKAPVATEDVQFAITSYGYGCAEAGYPAVNTDIPYFITWIEDALSIRGLGSVMTTPSSVPFVQISPPPSPQPSPSARKKKASPSPKPSKSPSPKSPSPKSPSSKSPSSKSPSPNSPSPKSPSPNSPSPKRPLKITKKPPKPKAAKLKKYKGQK